MCHSARLAEFSSGASVALAVHSTFKTWRGMMLKLAIIIVVTFSGNVHIIGSGDDCHAAWEHVSSPSIKDWREMKCVEIEID